MMDFGHRVGGRRSGRKTLSDQARRAFADRLARVVEMLGWKARDLAPRLGLDPNNREHVKKARSWMRARTGQQGTPPAMPDLPILIQIADETGASLDFLLLGREPLFPVERPAEGESFTEHFRRATAERMATKGDYDKNVTDKLLPDGRILWGIWTRAVFKGVEGRLAMDSRATRARGVLRADDITPEVRADITAVVPPTSAVETAITEARNRLKSSGSILPARKSRRGSGRTASRKLPKRQKLDRLRPQNGSDLTDMRTIAEHSVERFGKDARVEVPAVFLLSLIAQAQQRQRTSHD